jgi:DnaA-homolog protein
VSSQIPLPFGNSEHFSFEIFVPGQNQQVVDTLKSVIFNDTAELLYLWGYPGTGKSHLLQATCGHASRNKMKPVYIPLSEYAQLVPDILSGLESLDLVCIDDLDFIAGEPEWERAMFNLYNALLENNKSLVITSEKSPTGNTIILADLKSRLASGITYHLRYLAENERLSALRKRAELRGFDLSDEVLDYLSSHVARDMHTLFDWLERLDKASLVSKKKLSVSLVRELLNKK